MATNNHTRKTTSQNIILWLIYIALLGVLLPHTAWAFGRFEPPGGFKLGGASPVAWLAAIAFEAAIAALTHRLAEHIERVPNHKSLWLRVRRRYLNEYGIGLVVSVAVSALANLAHAVEYAQPLVLVGSSSLMFALYVTAFGAILPVSSLLFAAVLSNAASGEFIEDDTTAVRTALRRAEHETNAAEQRAKAAEEAANIAEQQAKQAEQRAKAAEQQAAADRMRFEAAGDLLVMFTAESKRDRILAIRQRWPELPQSAVALLAESSPSYVSDTLNNAEVGVN